MNLSELVILSFHTQEKFGTILNRSPHGMDAYQFSILAHPLCSNLCSWSSCSNVSEVHSTRASVARDVSCCRSTSSNEHLMQLDMYALLHLPPMVEVCPGEQWCSGNMETGWKRMNETDQLSGYMLLRVVTCHRSEICLSRSWDRVDAWGSK